MYRYNPIEASDEQIQKLYDKHCKIKNKHFSYDSEDNIGFVTLETKTGKKIQYQLRNKEPMFVEFLGFGNIRYDIHYPSEKNTQLYNFLKEKGIESEKEFWQGAEI